MSTSTSESPTQFSSLPDYQDFLTWLKGASKQLAGTNLNISLEAEFTPLTLQLQDNDFAAATGFNDQYSIKPYSLQLSDVSLMFSTRSSAYDVFGVDNQNLGAFRDDSISPLQLSQTYPELTYPDSNLADFNDIIWNYIATYPPVLSSGSRAPTPSNVPVLPLDAPTMILYYRKDVYDKLGLSPPKTWDDHYSNCQTIQKSGLVPYASASQASPSISIAYEFLSHVASFGGALWNVDGDTITPNLTDGKVTAALENFVRFSAFSDAGSIAYSWEDVFESLAHGVSASALLWDGYSTWVNDPARSTVTGMMAYSRTPAGPVGSYSTLGSAGVGVSKYSRNPKAAWLWLQWATAKGTEAAMILNKYHVYPTRTSALQIAQVSSALQSGSLKAAEVTNEVFQSKSLAALIGFPKWFEALQALSTHLNHAWQGVESPTQALTTAQDLIGNLGALTF